MVSITAGKESIFGLSSYKVPRAYTNVNLNKEKNKPWLSDTYSYSQAKDKGNFFEKQVKQSFAPGPGTYGEGNKWKGAILGHMKGGPRDTFIEKLFKDAKSPKGTNPGPGAYVAVNNLQGKRFELGKVMKGDRDPFVCDAEFLGVNTPPAHYMDVNFKLPKVGFKYVAKDAKKKGWKVDKVDKPGPG